MLELKVQTSRRRYVAPGDLVRVLGAERALVELGDMVEALIAQIDLLAGDPDLEETDAEDSFTPPADALDRVDGAGCPVSDGAGDVSWNEWHTRRRLSSSGYAHETIGVRPHGDHAHEDDEDEDAAEDDDPSGQCDEDGINTVREAAYSSAAGCPISDPDQEGAYCDGGPLPILSWGEDQTKPIEPDFSADRRIMATYRDRIRGASYIKVAPTWLGGQPSWRPANNPARPNFRI